MRFELADHPLQPGDATRDAACLIASRRRRATRPGRANRAQNFAAALGVPCIPGGFWEMSVCDRVDYRARLVALTGENWAPYPSERFVRAVVELPDGDARALIEDRRRFSFPAFLAGEPQLALLESYGF